MEMLEEVTSATWGSIFNPRMVIHPDPQMQMQMLGAACCSCCLPSFNNMDLWEAFFNFHESAIWTGEQVHPAVVPNPAPAPNITSLSLLSGQNTLWSQCEFGENRREEGRDQKETFLNVKRVSKLPFVCFEHAVYCLSIIPQWSCLNMLTEDFRVVESYDFNFILLSKYTTGIIHCFNNYGKLMLMNF